MLRERLTLLFPDFVSGTLWMLTKNGHFFPQYSNQ